MEHLVKKNNVANEFYTILDELRIERESNNYSMPISYSISMGEPDAGYSRVARMFDLIVPFIHSAANGIPGYDVGLIQREIGDGFGDDLTDEYCGEAVWSAITDRLIAYNLTT